MKADAKTIVAGAIVLAAAGTGGSMIGLTVEPQETTELRVSHATLETKNESLEEKVERLEARVDVLDGIVKECQSIIMANQSP